MVLSLYVSQQGCYLSLKKETLVVKRQDEVLSSVQLPLLEQILIFGKSQVTTQVIHACLKQNIPIVYLSRMGYCYGRIMSIERGYRQLSRYQQQLSRIERLITARQLVKGKLTNCKVILQRQLRRRESERLALSIQTLDYLSDKAKEAESHDQLLGFEGAGASAYFSAFGDCLTDSDFVFLTRSRRPPRNPVNALLSFGYQVLWNHLLALIEVSGLDPYQASLHEGSERHAALASDLIEEFRAPMVDSLVLYLIHRNIIKIDEDFEYFQGGCYLNDTGRKKYLQNFMTRMEEQIKGETQEERPKWDLLGQQVRKYRDFVYHPVVGYQPYQIR
ncbi:MAG: CRISPR-associated endonuclease Cas1 [Microcystaceae cyanobacterium]